MTKKLSILAILAIAILSSACSARRTASRPPVHTRTRTTVSTDTTTIDNNSNFILAVQEDGLPVEEAIKDNDATKIVQYDLDTGESVPLSYFQPLSRRQISLVAKAYCPESGRIATARSTYRGAVERRYPRRPTAFECTPGEYMGMTRAVRLRVGRSGSRGYTSRDWIITNRDIIGVNGRRFF